MSVRQQVAAAFGRSLIGTTVNNYRIKGLLGEGGMGAVFEAEHPLIGAKIITKAAPDAQVLVELRREVHCTPPAIGQGCEMDLSPSISSRTYIMVELRERCRKTLPTSSIDAPAFTRRVARL